MKKLAILAALTLMSLSATCLAQKATVALNNFDSNMPILIGGNPAKNADNVYVQLLGGTAGSVPTTPVVSTTGQTVFQVDLNAAPGFFDAGIGVVPGLAANAQGSFILQAWQGTAGNPGSFGGAANRGSVSWSQATGSWSDNLVPPPPPSGASLNIPSSITVGPAVPEPSTLALGLLGAAALLIRRRK
jgi:hypothetical protein